MKSRHSLLLAALLAASVAGCGTRPVDRRLLQQISDQADRHIDDAAFWKDALGNEAPEVRAQAARGIGRLRSATLLPLLSSALESEKQPRVAEELLFAAGQIGDDGALTAVRSKTVSPEPGVRGRAAEALGKLGRDESLETLVGLLGDTAPEVRGTALEAIVRLRGRRVASPRPLPEALVRHIRERVLAMTADPSADVRWRAVYCLSEVPLPDRFEPLAAATQAGEADSRLFAARGLGRLLEQDPSLREETAPVLLPLLDDPNPHVAAAAARVLGRIPDPAVQKALAAAFRRRRGPADFHLRLAVAEGKGLPPELIGQALEDPSFMVRAAALEAAAAVRELGTPVLAEWARSESRWQRAAAARAARALERSPALDLLETLAKDADPLVASTALSTLGDERFDGAAERVHALLLEGLARQDVAIAGTAVSLLRERGSLADLAALESAFAAARSPEETETRVEAVRTVAAWLEGGEAGGPGGGTEPARARRFLEQALNDRSPAVARAAADSLEQITGMPAKEPPVSHESSSVAVEAGKDFASGRPDPRVVLHTTKGRIVLELLREAAPRHVKSFLSFAREGRYDGLPFHRVVSGFVIQGLDPRGDGWGTGGVNLRDEINPVPYLRGTVGMPNAGPDTGGCQIFITHVPTPHLDGRYTVFGRVVEGMDVVDTIEVSDVCDRVEIR